MKVSSVEEDELAIFLLPMPLSLPGGEVGVSASFRTISFSFEAVRGEYLSRTERNAKGGNLVRFAPGINWPRIDALAVLLVHVGLAQARPTSVLKVMLMSSADYRSLQCAS